MRPRTVVAIVAVVVLLGGAAVLGLMIESTSGGSLSEAWTSDTDTGVVGNHHAPAVGVVDGEPMVYAPLSGRSGGDQCRLAGLSATDGDAQWRHDIEPQYCEIHSVADPTLADVDGDGTSEVLAATTRETVTAHDPHTGDVEFRHDLTSYGYTQPVVADLGDDGSLEIVVVDARGTVIVVGADGTEHWRDELDSYTFGQPALRDFDGDGETEIAVGNQHGTVRLYGPDGEPEWERPNATASQITWLTTTDRHDGAGPGVVVATVDGTVALLDGADGTTRWEREFEGFSAVRAVADGDDDGRDEIYAVAQDGVLRSLEAGTGDTEWTTTLTTENVQTMPPPSAGDLDGDGDEELLAVTRVGDVTVVDPANGETLASAGRDVPILTHATLADTDGDGAEEAYVIYGDGRIASYIYDGE